MRALLVTLSSAAPRLSAFDADHAIATERPTRARRIKHHRRARPHRLCISSVGRGNTSARVAHRTADCGRLHPAPRVESTQIRGRLVLGASQLGYTNLARQRFRVESTRRWTVLTQTSPRATLTRNIATREPRDPLRQSGRSSASRGMRSVRGSTELSTGTSLTCYQAPSHPCGEPCLSDGQIVGRHCCCGREVKNHTERRQQTPT